MIKFLIMLAYYFFLNKYEATQHKAWSLACIFQMNTLVFNMIFTFQSTTLDFGWRVMRTGNSSELREEMQN